MIEDPTVGFVDVSPSTASDDASSLDHSSALLAQELFALYRNMSPTERMALDNALDGTSTAELPILRRVRTLRAMSLRMSRHLARAVEWPTPEITLPTNSWFEPARPARHVFNDREGNSGTFFSRLNDRSVEFESALEYRFLTRLEICLDVEGYVEQPFELGYSVGSQTWVTVPDVLVRLHDGSRVVVEIKHRDHMALWRNLSKFAHLRAYCSSNGLGCLITDGSLTPADLERRLVDPAFEIILLDMLQASVDGLDWNDVAPLKKAYNVTGTDLSSLVLKHQLKYSLKPFWLGGDRHPPRGW